MVSEVKPTERPRAAGGPEPPAAGVGHLAAGCLTAPRGTWRPALALLGPDHRAPRGPAPGGLATRASPTEQRLVNAAVARTAPTTGGSPLRTLIVPVFSAGTPVLYWVPNSEQIRSHCSSCGGLPGPADLVLGRAAQSRANLTPNRTPSSPPARRQQVLRDVGKKHRKNAMRYNLPTRGKLQNRSLYDSAGHQNGHQDAPGAQLLQKQHLHLKVERPGRQRALDNPDGGGGEDYTELGSTRMPATEPGTIKAFPQ